MRNSRRYDTSGLVETQFERGSRKTVLKNLLGITRREVMDVTEAQALKEVAERVLANLETHRRYTCADIRTLHKLWLGNIYPWAGAYRRVNMSKGNIVFAAAVHIPSLMQAFEEGPLARHTPCVFSSTERVIQALAEVHTELILIHPFREGNGRIARLFAWMMARQAGVRRLDFGVIKGRWKDAYFAAIREGLRHNHKPMEEIFSRVIFRGGR